jgi:hypothetical protein
MCCHRFAPTKPGNSPFSLALQATVRNSPIKAACRDDYASYNFSRIWFTLP